MRLGELLVNAGKITPAQLDETLKGQAIFGGRFGTNLVEMGYLDEDELAHFLSKKIGIPHALPEQFADIPPQVIKLIPEETVRKHRVMPISVNNRKLTLAMLDPTDYELIDEISFATGLIVVPIIAPELRMITALEKYYGIKREVRYISVQGGSRNRAQMSKNAPPAHFPPVLAKVTIPTPPPAPQVVDWFGEEESEILELPALDEIELLDEPVELAPAAPVAPAVAPLAPSQTAPPASAAPAASTSFGNVATVQAQDALEGSAPYQQEPDYSLDGVVRGLADAADRDEIADLVTGHLAQQFDRVALFLHRGGRATGWVAQVGRKPVAEFEALEIPLAEQSVLKLVDESKSFYLGPLPATPMNKRLVDAIGGGNPTHNLLIPLMMAGRVVSVLYVDGGNTPLDAKLPDLQKLIGKASLAFEILILKNKILMA